MDAPGVRPTWVGKLLILFTLVLFCGLVKLGFWQLSRADEKAALLAEQESRFQATPLNMDSLISRPLAEAEGAKLEVTGELLSTPTVLLDNQVLDGKVGYLAYRFMQVPGFEALLPVELGFVEAGSDRRALPRLEATTGELTLRGRLYRRSINPMSAGLNLEPGEPARIQALDMPALAKAMKLTLLDIGLQPDTLATPALPRRWMPVNMSVEKHLGYAIQWFSLAAALLILMLIYGIKNRRRQT
ncbi:SURF1 family protein [Shewanella sp. JM162201]|uniref:SURF1-like protein n=1 Tax=Shewanella jiangmenensis TaxID=2837387 RepID=A0ABS5V412_9GAMM|nr:SURF1 family protein [Shewanella jiangmenensis]MBT1445197.1 SURF1 family protein [Shewanella jiangmenensis]